MSQVNYVDFVPCLHEHKADMADLTNAAMFNNSVVYSDVAGCVASIIKKHTLRHQRLYTFNFFYATFRCIARK